MDLWKVIKEKLSQGFSQTNLHKIIISKIKQTPSLNTSSKYNL